jgi:hypothetical protein
VPLSKLDRQQSARAEFKQHNAEHSGAHKQQTGTLPTSASIETLEPKQTKAVCSEMVRILDGATVDDLQFFAKAATLLSANGYEPGNYADITRLARLLVAGAMIEALKGLFPRR